MCDMKSSFRTAESLNKIKMKCQYCQRISTIEPDQTSADKDEYETWELWKLSPRTSNIEYLLFRNETLIRTFPNRKTTDAFIRLLVAKYNIYSKCKICEICHHRFIAKRQDTKYCPKCKKAHRPLYQWRIKRYGIPNKRKCRYCGKEFQPKRKTGLYCSAKCRVYYNLKKAQSTHHQERE